MYHRLLEKAAGMHRLAAVLFAVLCVALPRYAEAASDNAVRLDGRDNNLRIGMDIVKPPYTLELWFKGNDARWEPREMLLAGGDYSFIDWVDNAPLMVLDGRLHSAGARLTAPQQLDSAWHHAALVCDGQATALFLDGRQVARRDTAVAVLPGALGIQGGRNNNNGTNFFAGEMDEVRIWRAALQPDVLRSWMGRSVTNEHPAFPHLYGYYPLDDLDSETSVNWVGRGHLNFHVRNGRNKQGGDAPLAYAVPNGNAAFHAYEGRQRLFNAVVIESEWDSDRGSRDQQVLKLRVAVQGSRRPMRLTSLDLDLSGTTDLKDIDAVHVYYTGQKARHTVCRKLTGAGLRPQQRLHVSFASRQAVTLQPGINYFLVTFDVNAAAPVGHTLRATVPSFRLDRTDVRPDTTAAETHKMVTLNSRLDANVVKVLQWNIWHGGRHVGAEGPRRVIELIEAQHPDVVMMQEAYGIQKSLASRLGFRVKTKSDDDNLALYTHLPLQEVPWREPFKSNPAILTLRNGRKVYFQCLWIMYSADPEYTCYFMQRGQDPRQWAGQDCAYPLADITNILLKDVDVHAGTLPVIMTGDFNSCSHLDWTKRTDSLHYGYGQVRFPVSQFVMSRGFVDTFRFMNPDEVAYHGGTVSEVHGHLQHSRIDFIYHRGEGVRVLGSKIVRTAPDIDFVWPSDHAAVVGVFEIK